VICTTKTGCFQKHFQIKKGRVFSAGYAGAMAMRPMICQHMSFYFSLGFGNMIVRLTLTIAIVQRLKCQSKFKKKSLTTRHDHNWIRNNTFDQLFLICRGVLNAKLVADSCLNFEENLWKPKPMQQSTRELLKPTFGPELLLLD